MHDRRDCEDDRRGDERCCGDGGHHHDEHHECRHHHHDEHDGCCHHHEDEQRGCCHHHDERPRDYDDRRGGDRPGPCGDGPDTRFLHLEMSQLLYGEAECVTRQAWRELLGAAAKARLRERFGDKITGLAQLAVDELVDDMLANLEIEGRIQERARERGRTKERLREIFGRQGGERGARPEGKDARTGDAPCREGEGGAGGGTPGTGQDG